MPRPFHDHIEFFRQFRERFVTTGAIAPSSRFVANAITGPLRQCQSPRRILEIGPGTGALTQRIVQLLQPGDQFDLVELNETFAEMLENRFKNDKKYQPVAEQAKIHICPLQEFHADEPYDIIISGLPLNNFPAELVSEIFEVYFRLLAPGGVLSYFEYMYVRPVRKLLAGGDEKARLKALDEIMGRYITKHRVRKSWVFVNFPPAWVQHLQNTDASG